MESKDGQSNREQVTDVLSKQINRFMKERPGWADWRGELYELSPRWQWWTTVLQMKQLPPSICPYPKITFEDNYPENSAPMRMIKRCLSNSRVAGFNEFVDWILYRLGSFHHSQLSSKVTQHQIEHWEKEFDLKVLLDHPGDWFGEYYQLNEISRSTVKKDAFFATPMSICTMIAAMTMTQHSLLSEANDPCVGTGRFLMAASNFVLNLSGQDINQDVLRICTLNGWLYMPSLVAPCKELEVATQIEIPENLKLIKTKHEVEELLSDRSRVSTEQARPAPPVKNEENEQCQTTKIQVPTVNSDQLSLLD